MSKDKIAHDLLFTSHELNALADLFEPYGEHCLSRVGAEGLAIMLRRIAKRLRKHSIQLEEAGHNHENE